MEIFKVSCKECNKELGYRNKSGYCNSHKNIKNLLCSTEDCSSKISAINKTLLCKICRDSKWYLDNLNHARKVSNDYYHNNKAKINEYRKNREVWRWHNDFNFKLKKTLRSRLKKAMKENWEKGGLTESLGCSVPELKQHLESLFQPGMTWENRGLYGWHIDHIKPLVNAKDKDGFLKLQHYTNLQPLWAIDNLKKGTK